MDLREELQAETKKWLDRIKKIKFNGEKDFIRNINAYISDSEYFLEKGDLIRAFECIVWAWAWLEIGIMVGKVKKVSDINK